MSWVEDTLRTFGESIQMEDLDFNHNGVVCLAIEKMGTLYLEKGDETVRIYLSREKESFNTGYPARALNAVHYRENLPFPITAAMRDENTLVFIAVIPESEFSPPNLDRILEILTQLHDSV
ncbi:hypothetical protein [Acanthopleuribacter pedis]|uniref:Uncharacterized protein n=1 Tax=Acanthopleuribacter pedis TaxID=442870 RepID=A0A8J7QHK5_9BACT|nr:hypothetical protein [Acanthopleuribacter pedis]MBO1322605.1 hypothetical protein [Acanthopleuribacter pedis]